jgi:hypothetical protein
VGTQYLVTLPFFSCGEWHDIIFIAIAALINPQQQQVEIYRARQDVEVRNLPTELSGENILPEFRLNLSLY